MTGPGFCPQCGTQRQGSMRFCASCGLDFWKAAEEQAAQAQTDAGQRPAAVRPDVPIAGGTRSALGGRPWLLWVAAAVVAIAVLGAINYAFGTDSGEPVGAASDTASPSPGESAVATPFPTQRPRSSSAGCADGQIQLQVDGEYVCVDETPAPSTLPDLSPPPAVTFNYRTLGDRAWEQVVKSPDKHYGESYVVWACITQFDAATGDEVFRGEASNKNRAYWYLDGDNAIFTGTARQLRRFVKDDVVEMKANSLGSFTYDTQIGGESTVPMFYVHSIHRRGSCA